MEEIELAMPGDGVISDPNFNASRAVTIAATPSDIWPWIVQMGYRRAGFYSFDRLDNHGIPSADHLIHRYQHLAVGDSIPLTAHEYATVTLMEPDSLILWQYAGDDTSTAFTWAWRLYSLGAQQTRLVSRLRYRAPSARSRVTLDLFEIWMTRKCMLGIRDRAENRERGGNDSGTFMRLGGA